MKSLSIKNLGPVSRFLKIRGNAIDTCAYTLDQEESIGELLRERDLVSANPTRTPTSEDFYDESPNDSVLLTKIKNLESQQSRCGRVTIAKLMMRPRLSTGTQTTDYRRGYSVSVSCNSFLTFCTRR